LVILIFVICAKFKPSLRLRVWLLSSQASHIIFNVFNGIHHILYSSVEQKIQSFQLDTTYFFSEVQAFVSDLYKVLMMD
jgi:hypothetical protein